MRPAAQRLRRPNAFTVMEAMLSAAVVAVLLALAFSVFSQIRKRAQASQCATNLRQLGAALQVFATEHQGFLPASYRLVNTDGTGATYWYNLLQDGIALVGSNRGILPNPNVSNSPLISSVYLCPSNPTRIDLWRHPNYAYNRALGEVNPSNASARQIRLANVAQPSRVVAIVDAGVRGKSSRTLQLAPETRCHDRTRSIDRASTVGYQWHDGLAHFLMLDGHVEALRQEVVEQRFAHKQLLWEFPSP